MSEKCPNDIKNSLNELNTTQGLSFLPMTGQTRSFGGVPTQEQLDRINGLTLKPLSREDVFVFNPLMIDTLETSHCSMVHERLIDKLTLDANSGVALLLSHDTRRLPVGRTFNAESKTDFVENSLVKSVYGEVYIPLGRNTESNMATDDIAQAISDGTISDVSIGFSFNRMTCSICGNDIRNYEACRHYPGRVYEIQGSDGIYRQQKCIAILGDNGEGSLHELSLVYAGACGRATIKQSVEKENVKEFDNVPKLSVVTNLKNVPENAKIYQYYSKNDCSYFTDVDERTEGENYLKRRSEELVELEAILNILTKELGVTIETSEQLEQVLADIVSNSSNVKSELDAKSSELEIKSSELEIKSSELDSYKEEMAAKDNTIAELKSENEALSSNVALVDAYRQDLIDQTITLGIRAQGNAFQTELFTKFLNTLSIEDIKLSMSAFDSEVNAKFEGVKVTKTLNTTDEDEKVYFDNNQEYRDFIADKSMAYAKENKVDYKDALKIMSEKYKEVK